ncbi:SulP family inorganic anion transporter [bacterium]|nr:MAG: SulP family inorganic anion transporter [bacterium]
MIRLSEVRREGFAGLTTSFAMVPEVVGFAFVLGVNPRAGLIAAFIVGLITALFGGRPGMISGGAGSIAVVAVALVAGKGPEFLFLAVALMGVIQIAVGLLRWGRFISLVPHPVMLGFVNGLAIVIFLAQLEQFKADGHWMMGSPLAIMLGLVASTIAIALLAPKVTKAVPGSLIAIVVVSLLSFLLKIPTKSVGDLASMSGPFPLPHLPSVPYAFETLKIVLPVAITMAAVGLTESLLTLGLVDELTDTQGEPDRECVGLGIANVASGLFGGMGGCAMIGQTVLNLQAGGKRRLSGVFEALSILAFMLVAAALIERIPIAALVGVMMVVVYETFAWSSIRRIRKIPLPDAFVLVLVSAVTVFTNLATAVVAGVIVSALVYAYRQGAQLRVERRDDAHYIVDGDIFFGSAQTFGRAFTAKDDADIVTVDMSQARAQDHSAIQALQSLVERYARAGKTLRFTGLTESCDRIVRKAYENLPTSEPADA